MNKSLERVQTEFKKQQKLYGPEHDTAHTEKELVWAAISYLRLYVAETLGDRETAKGYWPWEDGYNPKTPRQVLTAAGAFIISELERIDNVSDDL